MHPNQTPWVAAMEAQAEALRAVLLLRHNGVLDTAVNNHGASWHPDIELLQIAAPFAWSTDAIRAVEEASRSIPLDTPLRWNLNTTACWWHFETPLPFQTIHEPAGHRIGVRALAFGWLSAENTDTGEIAFATDPELGALARAAGLPVSAWVDAPVGCFTPLQPSQTFGWDPDATLGEMLDTTRQQYASIYGPGGIHADVDTIGIDAYMAATEGLARFILAGIAWLQQKILVSAAAPVERHARKRYAKAMGGAVRELRVVQLRRTDYTHGAEADMAAPSDTPRHFSCCFTVVGYWANLACGPRRSERRLTFIEPHMSGNREAPFRPKPEKTVYVVRR